MIYAWQLIAFIQSKADLIMRTFILKWHCSHCTSKKSEPYAIESIPSALTHECEHNYNVRVLIPLVFCCKVWWELIQYCLHAALPVVRCRKPCRTHYHKLDVHTLTLLWCLWTISRASNFFTHGLQSILWKCYFFCQLIYICTDESTNMYHYIITKSHYLHQIRNRNHQNQ